MRCRPLVIVSLTAAVVLTLAAVAFDRTVMAECRLHDVGTVGCVLSGPP